MVVNANDVAERERCVPSLVSHRDALAPSYMAASIPRSGSSHQPEYPVRRTFSGVNEDVWNEFLQYFEKSSSILGILKNQDGSSYKCDARGMSKVGEKDLVKDKPVNRPIYEVRHRDNMMIDASEPPRAGSTEQTNDYEYNRGVSRKI
ncbi:unnamed protein product [Mytilus coruscus]|uniref:Uncharacterized protein n=1 Tax=Mytilus coruscus TaxID=42192 RepID=A0A6J8DF67_MYTCO|nr:unnamed protein product [Mytilus coruscus]